LFTLTEFLLFYVTGFPEKEDLQIYSGYWLNTIFIRQYLWFLKNLKESEL